MCNMQLEKWENRWLIYYVIKKVEEIIKKIVRKAGCAIFVIRDVRKQII